MANPTVFFDITADDKALGRVVVEVVEGMDVVTQIKSFGSGSGKPSKKIAIASCGDVSGLSAQTERNFMRDSLRDSGGHSSQTPIYADFDVMEVQGSAAKAIEP